MFQKWSNVTIAADNYTDIINYPINNISRKQSIASYNFTKKILFYSHINKVEEINMSAEFRLIQLIAQNTKGDVFSVVCDELTDIAISRGAYVTYKKIKDLRSSSSILIDSEGFLCKIISIEKHLEKENRVYNIRSNKGNNKFVNGLMFKA